MKHNFVKKGPKMHVAVWIVTLFTVAWDLMMTGIMMSEGNHLSWWGTIAGMFFHMVVWTMPLALLTVSQSSVILLIPFGFWGLTGIFMALEGEWIDLVLTIPVLVLLAAQFTDIVSLKMVKTVVWLVAASTVIPFVVLLSAREIIPYYIDVFEASPVAMFYSILPALTVTNLQEGEPVEKEYVEKELKAALFPVLPIVAVVGSVLVLIFSWIFGVSTSKITYYYYDANQNGYHDRGEMYFGEDEDGHTVEISWGDLYWKED